MLRNTRHINTAIFADNPTEILYTAIAECSNKLVLLGNTDVDNCDTAGDRGEGDVGRHIYIEFCIPDFPIPIRSWNRGMCVGFQNVLFQFSKRSRYLRPCAIADNSLWNTNRNDIGMSPYLGILQQDTTQL